MSNQLQTGASMNDPIILSDDPIMISDDDYHQLLEEVISSGMFPNFDVMLSEADWEEFDRMLDEFEWDEITDDDMKTMIEWCNKIEKEEHQRMLHQYIENLNDIDMEEMFSDW